MAALAEIIRDERLLSQLERMASGGLDAAEQAALEERAKSDPTLQRALELCRPRADEFHQRLAQAAQTAMAPARRRRPHWARRYAVAIGGVAAAVIAAVVLLAPGPQAELPTYRATVTGAMEYRSESETPALLAGGPLEIVLRPATKVPAPIQAWFFVQHGGQLEPLSLAIEIDPSGSVRAVGTVGDWGDEATLVMAVSSDRAPSREEAAARASGWRWAEQKIRINR
jgi:hypothetical protein